ncbi:MAG: hypothetical protein HY908_03225 [Myxococcales bacterium]|nr:hypothetical protein [Myxococcales bacterium]
MLRSPLVFAGLSLTVLGFCLAAGCSKTEETVTPVDPHQPGKQPPAVSSTAVDGDGLGITFAVDQLFLGDTDRNGSPLTTAWRQFGYNLDQIISDGTGAYECKPFGGAAPSTVHQDGDQGTDNSFGKNILPIILGLSPTASSEINASIQEGKFTIMLDIADIGDKPDYKNLLTNLYGGGDLGAVPLWDGSDAWPVYQELLVNPNDITQGSKVKFTSSYVSGGTWVSGTPGTLDLTIAVAGYQLTLSINKAVISMDVPSDLSEATNGVIAGVLNTEDLIDQLRSIAGSFSTSLCQGTTFDSLADQLRATSDIMDDGSQNTASTCNGISIGLGFTAKPVTLGAVLPPAQPGTDPCNAGGGGAGGGTP